MFTVAKFLASLGSFAAVRHSPFFRTHRLSILHLATVLILLMPAGGAAAPGAAAPPARAGDANHLGETVVNGDIPLYGKFELTFDLSVQAVNPYNDHEIRVDLLITSPSGKALVHPAFYYQEYSAAGVNPAAYGSAVEILTPAGAPVWKARFTPTETGTYSYAVRVLHNNVPVPNGIQGTFRSVHSSGRGFLQASDENGANPLYFHFSNGDPFIGVGLNVGWWEKDSQGLSTYQHFFGRMDEYGANLARVWMTNSSANTPSSGYLTADKILSLQDTVLGSQYNLEDAWKFDRILEDAQQRDIFLILTLEDGHTFGKDYWEAHNLYKSELNNPFEFFDTDRADQDAIDYQKRLFRYIIARWGYSPSILAWEFFNEIDEPFRATGDYPAGLSTATAWGDLVAWHQAMAGFFSETDVHQHMVDTSTGSFQPISGSPFASYYPQLYEPMSFAQMHFYFVEDENEAYLSDPEGRDMAYLTEYYARHTRTVYPGKPFLLGEFGLIKGEYEQNGALSWLGSRYHQWDVGGIHLHNGLWASLMSGAASAGLHWNWHQIWLPEYGWWRHYAPVAAFTAHIDTAGLHPLAPTQLSATTSYTATVPVSGTKICSGDLCSNHPYVRAMGLRGNQETYLWVQNRLNTWWNETHAWQRDCLVAGNEPLTATITALNYSAGQPYLVEWWDPYQVKDEFAITGREVVTVTAGGELNLAIEELVTDVAVRIRPLSAALDVERQVDHTSLPQNGNVQITTRVWNRGNTALDVSVQDAACGSRSLGTMSAQSSQPYTYSCSFSADRDNDLAVYVEGLSAAGKKVNAAAHQFVAVADGIVGSGTAESCSETALRADVLDYTGPVVGFNCGPSNQYFSIFLDQELVITRPLTITTGTIQVLNGQTAPGNGVILSGQHRTRIFQVERPGQLTLEGLRLAAGAAHRCDIEDEYKGGGAISAGGNAIAQVINGRMFANSADLGGAVHVHALGKLLLKRTRLWENRAEALTVDAAAGTTALRGGGAAYTAGDLSVLENSQIFDNQANNGAGILNYNGALVVDRSQINNNSADNNGGGFQNSGLGTAVVSSSELTGNSAGNYGGGIVNLDNGSVEIHHSLLAGNSTLYAGGAIANVKETNTISFPTINLLNVTVANNHATSYGGALFNGNYAASVTVEASTLKGNSAAQGGGFYLTSGPLNLHNSILAGNTANQAAANDCFQNAYHLISGGFNLVGVGGVCFQQTAAGDLIGSAEHPRNPLLAKLAQNGGMTLTFALLAGSPALDAGDPSAHPGDDQRGSLRPGGMASDIGAYEMAQFSMDDATALESAGSMTFTVRLGGPAVQEVQVSYRTQNGTAVGCSAEPCTGTDFRHVADKLTFPIGTQSLTVTVPLLGDTQQEANETFLLLLSSPTNALIWQGEAEGLIVDDSTQPPGSGLQIHLPLVLSPVK